MRGEYYLDIRAHSWAVWSLLNVRHLALQKGRPQEAQEMKGALMSTRARHSTHTAG